MTTSVEQYFEEGCGRCALGGTPDCKVHTWAKPMMLLRNLILECGLEEESKWGVPCYSFQGKNIAVLSALKDYFVLSFFKGALLKDEAKILEKPGENTQAARIIKFTDSEKIIHLRTTIKAYLSEAIEVEKAGLKVTFKENPEPMPEELELAFEKDPILKEAFEKLTPGRKRGYILFISAPKQSKTRISRIEKVTPKIFEGKGVHDY